jgi:hypothetical protein
LAISKRSEVITCTISCLRRSSRQSKNREDSGVFNLWKAVELDPIDRARMQHQDLSLRIIVAFDPTGKFPLSIDEPSLLHDAESHIVFSNPKMSLKEAKGRRSGFCPFGI